MPSSPLPNLSRCAIHTQTNKSWSLRQCIDEYTRAGVPGISVWRNVLESIGAKAAGKMLRDSGMQVPALVRGGFFTSQDAKARQAAIDVNRVCIDEAREIGAEMVVLVVGATPGMALSDARGQVLDGMAAILDHARASHVKLAIEPLHPMYAGDRSCINRMAEARHVCQHLADSIIGIAVDVYHVWWDPDLEKEIALAGKQKTLFAFHVCDWRLDTRHLLTDRGLMGEGCIPLRQIRAWVEATGFTSFNEVEIFSEHYWAMDQREYLKMITSAYIECV
jgi:sugar phosphate isomerase/epimerase